MATTSLAQPAIQPEAKVLLRFWHLARLWHLTSLDAPTVAIAWTLAFAWAFQIHLPLWLPVTLALATWSFYIADRLFDAHRALQAAHTHSEDDAGCSNHRLFSVSLRPRHLFHWSHRGFFIPIAIGTALSAVILALINMPLAARPRNSFLAIAALAYFTSVHNPWRPAASRFSFKIPKELLVALIFTLACAIPTGARLSGQHIELLMPALAFIALAWLNCHAIEAWESAAAPRFSIAPVALSLAVFCLLACVLGTHSPRIAALYFAAALSAALLAGLDRTRHRIAPTTLRALADLVLLTPFALPLFRP